MASVYTEVRLCAYGCVYVVMYSSNQPVSECRRLSQYQEVDIRVAVQRIWLAVREKANERESESWREVVKQKKEEIPAVGAKGGIPRA